MFYSIRSCSTLVRRHWVSFKLMDRNSGFSKKFCGQTISAPASTAARNAAGSTEETQTCKRETSFIHKRWAAIKIFNIFLATYINIFSRKLRLLCTKELQIMYLGKLIIKTPIFKAKWHYMMLLCHIKYMQICGDRKIFRIFPLNVQSKQIIKISL